MNPYEDDLHEEHAPAVEIQKLLCWRCALEISPSDRNCPHCAAKLQTVLPDEHVVRTSPVSSDSRQLFVVITGFFILLLTSVVQGFIAWKAGEHAPQGFEIDLVIGVEIFDTIVVLIVWLMCGSTRLPATTHRYGIPTWLLAFPLLAILLTLNILIHAALRDYLRMEWLVIPNPGLTVTTIVVMCLQPAIVEELFFRYILFGVLRKISGVHATVLVSSTMFAICHIHVLLSMPYLFVVGVFLGYARVGSRSLVLPMILHFLHNLAVIWWESSV